MGQNRMSIMKFIGVLWKKLPYLILLPVLAGLLTLYLVKDTPKQYTSSTTIYTGITSNSGLDVTVSKVDKLMTQNEYSNIMGILKSNSLFEEISLRLLAQHLSLVKPDPEIISKESEDKVLAEIPADIKKLAVKGNEDETYKRLRNYLKPDTNNFLYKLLNSDHPFYSINSISRLKGEQVNSSDIFKLTYESRDPGICYNTVKFAAEVFIKTYGDIKRNLRSSAVKYFQDKLDEVSAKLNNAEDRLLHFNVDNTIINYYEQTKQVTTQHEEIELRLQTAKMNYEAADAVLKKLEAEISDRYAINLRNVEILNIRSQLVDCNNQIARYQVAPEDNPNIKIDELNARKDKLERALKASLDSIAHIETSTQGIESQKILGEWLDAVKNYEADKAMYRSMQDRQAEFMLQFKRYAPLGATIKRIEREIDVYENEYLNILNNLNIALQNEQNTDIISNMKMIDAPEYPITSIPSKKKMYIIIAMLVTFIFYVAAVLVIELLDNRIKTPTLLHKLTGLDVAGAYSIFNNKKFILEESISARASAFMVEKIRALPHDEKAVKVIQMLSLWDASGKSFVADKLLLQLQQLGYKAEILNLMKMKTENEKSEAKDNVPELLRQYYTANDYHSFVSGKSIDYLIVVLPSIAKGIDNSALIAKADISFVVYNAGLTWTTADQFNTDKLKGIITNEVYAVLTATQPEDLEEMYGDIPKKRSKFRVTTKKLLKRFLR